MFEELPISMCLEAHTMDEQIPQKKEKKKKKL